MKLLTFYDDKQILKSGILVDDSVIDVAKAAASLSLHTIPDNPIALLKQGSHILDQLQQIVDKKDQLKDDCLLDVATIQSGAAVPQPGKIVCVGLNYRRHAEEAGMAIPTEPVLFSKYNNTITGPERTVCLPDIAVEYDYEAELAFVIGKTAKNVSVEDALDYVLGYCNVNDVSARDLQLRTGQWLIGKTLDDFLPVGPYLLTADEVPNPQNLAIKTWRNGELVQNSNTADMIFSVAEIIAHISSLMTLEPGDLITTGTPEGVIFGTVEREWLTQGDEVIIEVEGFGQLKNRFSKA